MMLVLGLVGGWHLLQKWRLLPSLFVPKRVQVVHYDQASRPIRGGVCMCYFHLHPHRQHFCHGPKKGFTVVIAMPVENR
jgi:hypothetical protein